MTLQPIPAMVRVKSHAKPVAKGKKERASCGLLSDIPATLMPRYAADFQPSFIHASITISSDPWDKLLIDDAQDLFTAVFPEVTHEMSFGDIFYSPVILVQFLCFLYSDNISRQTRPLAQPETTSKEPHWLQSIVQWMA